MKAWIKGNSAGKIYIDRSHPEFKTWFIQEVEKFNKLRKMKTLTLAKGTFLIKKSGTVREISILDISETSVKIKWERGHVSWMTKEDFEFEYTIIERINPRLASR